MTNAVAHAYATQKLFTLKYTKRKMEQRFNTRFDQYIVVLQL